MKLKWIHHACFQLQTPGMTIYFDPYEMGKGEPPADLILVSHDHHDHYDVKSVKKILGRDTIVVCPKTCTSNIKEGNVKGLAPGDTVEVKGVTIEAVPAYNPNKKFHPKANHWLGYVVEIDGKRVYHAGDTDNIPEMTQLGPIDVAMLPVGDNFTMGFKEAVEATAVIKPKSVVPMHHWDKDLNTFKKMVEEKVPGVRVEILSDNDLEI